MKEKFKLEASRTQIREDIRKTYGQQALGYIRNPYLRFFASLFGRDMRMKNLDELVDDEVRILKKTGFKITP